MTTTTKRPSDAEIVKLLREASDVMIVEDKRQRHYAQEMQAAANALEADDLTERVMEYFNDHYDGIASVREMLENSLRAVGVR